MPSKDSQRAHLLRRFSRRYAIALAVVALLSIVGQALVQFMLAGLENESTVINIAGRQRMLSQRIVKLALLYRDTSDPRQLEELQRASELWQSSYQLLLDEESFGQKALSPKVRQMYEELEPHYRAMLEATVRFVQASRAGGPPQAAEEALEVLTAHDETFLTEMNQVVFQYDAEARSQVRALRFTELALLATLLLTLIFEVFFVFRPPIRDLGRTLAELDRTVANLERAERGVLIATERERERLGQEMHDGLCQQIAGLRLIAAANPEVVADAAGDALEAARRITHGLLPAKLREQGIRPAIESWVRHVEAVYEVETVLEGETDPELEEEAALQLYRIAQEAMNNAAQHSGASLIKVRLTDVDDAVELVVHDDGRGFDPKRTSLGLGLSIMRSRARMIGARLLIESRDKTGTTIRLKARRASSSS